MIIKVTISPDKVLKEIDVDLEEVKSLNHLKNEIKKQIPMLKELRPSHIFCRTDPKDGFSNRLKSVHDLKKEGVELMCVNTTDTPTEEALEQEIVRNLTNLNPVEIEISKYKQSCTPPKFGTMQPARSHNDIVSLKTDRKAVLKKVNSVELVSSNKLQPEKGRIMKVNSYTPPTSNTSALVEDKYKLSPSTHSKATLERKESKEASPWQGRNGRNAIRRRRDKATNSLDIGDTFDGKMLVEEKHRKRIASVPDSKHCETTNSHVLMNKQSSSASLSPVNSFNNLTIGPGLSNSKSHSDLSGLNGISENPLPSPSKAAFRRMESLSMEPAERQRSGTGIVKPRSPDKVVSAAQTVNRHSLMPVSTEKITPAPSSEKKRQSLFGGPTSPKVTLKNSKSDNPPPAKRETFTWFEKTKVFKHNGHPFLHGNVKKKYRVMCSMCNKIILAKLGFECLDCGIHVHGHCLGEEKPEPCICPPDQPPLKALYEGVLILKKGEQQKGKPTYARLNTLQLTIFPSKDDPLVNHFMKLKNFIAVKTIEDCSLSFELYFHKNKEFKIYGFESSERDEWVKQLNKAKEYFNQSLSESFENLPKVQMKKKLVKKPSTIPTEMYHHSDSLGSSFKTNLDEEYEVDYTDILGQGQFGLVLAAQNRKTKINVAVKIINIKHVIDEHPDDESREKALKSLKTEIEVLGSTSHPCIITCFQIYCNEKDLFLVMERAAGDFLDRILDCSGQGLSDRMAKFFIYQILIALDYLHEKRIAHRDLKPENILMATSDALTLVKVCDFGVTAIVGEDSFMKSVIGTPFFVAPEIYKQGKQEHGEGYGFKADIYSLGVLGFICLSGVYPEGFDEDSDFPALFDDVSDIAKNWVRRTMCTDVNTRFDTRQALHDCWLKGKNLKEDLQFTEKHFNISGTFRISEFVKGKGL